MAETPRSPPKTERSDLLGPMSSWQWLMELALFTFAYWLSAKAGIEFIGANRNFSPFWPPSGVALYVLLTRRLSLWPGIFIGYLLSIFPFHVPPLTGVGFALAATFEPLFSALVLKHSLKISVRLNRVADIVRFILIASLLSPLLSSFIAIGVARLTGASPADIDFAAWRTYLIGNSLGALVFTPLLLSLRERERKRFDRRRALEATALTLVTLGACEYVFLNRAPIGFLIYPCIFWASLRFGTLGVSSISLLVSIWGASFTARNLGPFASSPDENGLAMFQLFIGIGAVAGLLITTASQAEAKRRALREVNKERKRFQLAAENASDFILEWDTRTNRIQWWGRIEEALGDPSAVPRTLEEFLAIIHPDDRQPVMDQVEKHLREGGRIQLSYRVMKRNGSVAYWTASGEAIPDDHSGTPTRWIGAITDVTSRKAAEEALKRSEERYHLATTAASTGVWEWDSATDLNHWSEVVSQLFGTDKTTLPREEVLSLIHPEDRAGMEKKIRFAFEHQEPYFDSEFRVIWPDGSMHWLRSKGQITFDENGKPISARGTTHEITESKKFQEELKRAKDRAEEASHAKMQFLANMSHEIRTPMNAILGFADLLAREESLSEDKRREFISRIKSNGDQLLALIDDILDLSKFEAGDVPLEKLHFSFVDMLGELIRTLTPLAERKRLQIRTEFVTAMPQVIVSDPVRIEQILTNLIGNAIKFTDHGSITLRLRFARNDRTHGSKLIIDVEDTGIGISAQAQQRLFQPFSQGDTSVTRRFGGTGLGLVLSRRLAHALGGSLDLTRSIPGQGSCFTLSIDPGDVSRSLFVHELTHRKEKEKPKLRTVSSSSPQLKGLRVLLAEDSPDNEALVKLYLSMEGSQVLVAHNGAEAVQMARANDVDLILMDVQMPVMDGLEATRRLRSQGYRKPIVALTAHALQDEVKRTTEAGCDAHLTKPINRATLTRAIAMITGRPYREEETQTSTRG